MSDGNAYTGHVEPGGPVSSRTVETDGTAVEVRKLSVGPMDNNVYVLRDTDSNEALLVDAANDAARILREVDGLDVRQIVTTHGHWDHWQALDEVADATGASVWLHPADAEMVPRRADDEAADGALLHVGAAAVRLLHTPGHTRGSVCLLLAEQHLFTGDTLFPGGPGNTFGDADAFRTIMTSLRERLFALPDDTWVYPGHGDDTTLGAERPSLDEWQARGW
ncbi:MAG: MBL fold metallo-hydrolase [Actinomycetota bacterium]|nr:MBL fold metallo-hydrolase [Actinomycetota bacterium]